MSHILSRCFSWPDFGRQYADFAFMYVRHSGMCYPETKYRVLTECGVYVVATLMKSWVVDTITWLVEPLE